MAKQFALVQQSCVSTKSGARGWKTGQGWLTTWTPEMVALAPDPCMAWAEYAQQTLGVPWPTQKDLVILRVKVKELFSHYPRANWYTLCRLVQWCKNTHKRDSRVWQVIARFRAAWTAGALPELDPSALNINIESRIECALESETDPSWRRRLLGAMGAGIRKTTIEAWEAEHHGVS